MRIVLLVLAGLALASCGDKKSQEVTFTVKSSDGEDQKVKGEVSHDKDTVTFTSEKGAATFSSGDAAAKAAEGLVAAYPGAKVLSTIKGASEDGEGGMVVMTSGDSPEKVLGHYKKVIADRGMKVKTEITTGDSRMISASDDHDGMQVMIQPGDKGETQITVMSGAKTH